MKQKKSATKTFIDPKEHLVNNEILEQKNKQLREKSNKTREKRPSPSDDEDTSFIVLGGDKQHETPQGKKKTRTRGDVDFSNNKNGSIDQQHLQEQVPTTSSNNNDKPEQLNITNHALAYAIEKKDGGQFVHKSALFKNSHHFSIEPTPFFQGE